MVPTPDQIEAVQKIAEKIKKKKNKKVQPHMIKGAKTKEEIEQYIVDYLVT